MLIRDVFHCTPGQVRPLVEKFKKMNNVNKKMGIGNARLLTDLSAERYWTLVTEWEVKDLADFQHLMKASMDNKEMEDAMKGYHDHVVNGRREIYTIEA